MNWRVTVACMWCGQVIGYRPSTAGQHGKVSHGGCRPCWEKHVPDLPPSPEQEAQWVALEASLKNPPAGGLH